MDSQGTGEGPSATGAASVEWAVVDSPIGPLLLAATATGLVNVAFHARPAVRDTALGPAGTVRHGAGGGTRLGPADGAGTRLRGVLRG